MLEAEFLSARPEFQIKKALPKSYFRQRHLLYFCIAIVELGFHAVWQVQQYFVKLFRYKTAVCLVATQS